MMKDGRGLAALFDAIIFLAIASVVSVSLLSAFSSVDAEERRSMDPDVIAAHQAILRSTIAVGGNTCSLAEAAAMGASQEALNETIGGAVGLLLHGWEWRWAAGSENTSMSIGVAKAPLGTDIFVSTITMPIGDGEWTFTLEVWTA